MGFLNRAMVPVILWIPNNITSANSKADVHDRHHRLGKWSELQLISE
jgi:hypothetical protein